MGNRKKKGDKGSDPGNPQSSSQSNPEHPVATQQQTQKPESKASEKSQEQQGDDMKGKRPPNDGDRPGPSRGQPQKKERKTQPGDWVCSKCSQNNFAKNTDCYRCKVPKPMDVGPPQQSSSAPQQHSQPSSAPQHASAQQQPQESRQKDQPKKERKLAPGDWMCPKCDNHNFAKKNQCNRCKEPKPANAGVQSVPQQPQQAPSRSQSAHSSEPLSPAASFQNLKLSPTKHSKHSSQFMIESSNRPTEYEGKRGKNCLLEVNYGKISLDPKKLPKEAFHYDVTFDPETPKKFLPYALDEFMKVCFPGYIFGSDNRKNIYTSAGLRRDGIEVDEQGFSHQVTARMGDRTRDYKVTVKFTGVKDLQILMNYTNPIYQNEDKPMEAIQALDVILRKPFKVVPGTIQVARGLYFAPSQIKPLGDGSELWYGLFQSAIMGRSGLFLNVDVLHKAFPSAMPLLKYIQEFVLQSNRGYGDRGPSAPAQIPRSLNNYQMRTLEEHLKMLTIAYRFNGEVKTYGFNGLIAPEKANFTDDSGKRMSVVQYYQQAKGKRLQYPEMPYLWVGSRNKNVYLPLEFCEIPAGQATNKKCSPQATAAIIKYSATSTEERKQKIKGLLNQINYQSDPTVTGFGINVDKNFQKIEGRVIDPPRLKYADGSAEPRSGAWNGKKFLQPASGSIKWCIVNCDDRTRHENLLTFKKDFMRAANAQRIDLMDFPANELRQVKVDFNFKRNIAKTFAECQAAGYRLVVVIIVDHSDCYGRVKQAAELEVGILTQCIKANTIFRMGKGNPLMTINNILLKVSAKLNGKNHEIEEQSYNAFNQRGAGVMFVGADVTHPSPDQRTIPSVVGVASSYDDVGFRYCCGWRLQDPRKEMIEDLAEILVEHLQFYLAKNRSLPAKIMYYRDGVSDGQFKEVLAVEMSAIQKALQTVYGNKQPHARVTFIVVQKRHHTRFFPTQKQFTDGKNCNIMPGTVVDKNIVHPFQYQFFMASHAAIQGVTKPTKYCILVNESKISPDDLQAITYDLCHLFTRCNRSVSYPAPTYYAHLVAARGKNYFAGDRIDLNNLKQESRNRVIRPAITNNAPMFFV